MDYCVDKATQVLSDWLTESFIEDLRTRNVLKGLMLLCGGSIVAVKDARADIVENLLEYVISASSSTSTLCDQVYQKQGFYVRTGIHVTTAHSTARRSPLPQVLSILLPMGTQLFTRASATCPTSAETADSSIHCDVPGLRREQE